MDEKILLLLISVVLFFGCTSGNASESKECLGDTCALNLSAANTTTNQSNAVLVENKTTETNITVEVYHFHGTHQCYSCIRVGELAEKTVNTYFKDELESGKVVFGHVNGELPENGELVARYGAAGSSLWIGTYVNGEFSKEQNVNVWYKINDEEGYIEYLKGVLEKRLSGDLS